MISVAPQVRGAGFSHLGRKPRQEDRWAVAEVDGVAIGAVADGMSQPSGHANGAASVSAAVAELVVTTFVEVASRRLEAQASPGEAVREGLAAARRAARSLDDQAGGAAFVGACLAADGTLSLVKVGDCRAFGDFGDGRLVRATTGDDADRSGALTAWIGSGARDDGGVVGSEVIIRRGCRALVLASDGVWRTLANEARSPASPFVLARELVTEARRAGETDNLAAVVLAVSPSEARAPAPLERYLSPAVLAVAAIMFFIAGLLAAALLPEGWR